MIVARISMSFDRGVARNNPQDVGLGDNPVLTPEGGEIRGLGTHFISPEAKVFAEKCTAEEARIRKSLDRRLMRSPIPGLYVLSYDGEGDSILRSLDPIPEVNARCKTYNLTSNGSIEGAELTDWIERIKAQLKMIPIGKGRGKSVSEEGIEITEQLAKCPILSESTKNAILSLVAKAKFDQIEKMEFRRQLVDLTIEIDTADDIFVAPGRGGPLLDTTDTNETSEPVEEFTGVSNA